MAGHLSGRDPAPDDDGCRSVLEALGVEIRVEDM
jgi:hypothetical protein